LTPAFDIRPLGAQASSLHWVLQNFLQARCLRSQVNRKDF